MNEQQPFDSSDGDPWNGARRMVSDQQMPMACLGVAAEVAQTVAYLSPIGPSRILKPAEQAMVIDVGFEGYCHGQMTVALSKDLSARLARNMLGLGEDDAVDADAEIEAAKELANILAGNVLARLWGSEVEFKLSPPRIAGPRVLSGDPLIALECLEGSVALSIDATCDLLR